MFLTAKAMPGDREKSLAAGASDYITKPVDLDRLLAVDALVARATRDARGRRGSAVVDDEPPPKILLVDDRPENLLALEAILRVSTDELVARERREEALKQLLVDDVAVILLDVQMPDMDGFETAAHIKRRERTRDIPIMFLTAIDGEAHLAFRGYAAGAVDYLAKPFDPWVLRAKVGVFVELWAVQSQLAARAAEHEALGAAVDDALDLLGLPGSGPVADEVLDRVRGRLGAVRAGID